MQRTSQVLGAYEMSRQNFDAFEESDVYFMLRLAHHVSRRPQTSHRALSRHTCRRNISTVKTELLEELTSRGLVADVTRFDSNWLVSHLLA